MILLSYQSALGQQQQDHDGQREERQDQDEQVVGVAVLAHDRPLGGHARKPRFAGDS